MKKNAFGLITFVPHHTTQKNFTHYFIWVNYNHKKISGCGGSAMAILSLFLKNTHPRKIECWKCILTWCVKYSLSDKINRCSRGVYMYFSHFEKKIMVWGPPIAAKSGILYFPGTLILVNICSKPPCFEAYFERLFADNFVSRPCIMLKFFSRVKNS